MSNRWRMYDTDAARDGLEAITDPHERCALVSAIRGLPDDPKPATSEDLRTVTTPRVRKLKTHHGAHYRALYVIFPSLRVIFLATVVLRTRDTYEVERIRAVARAAKAFRRSLRKPKRNPGLDTAVRTALADHLEWGDSRIAAEAGCAPEAVRRRRIAWGIPARHSLPWIHESAR